MSTAHAIQVSGLSPSTTDQKVEEFFAFCGKITSVEHDGTKGVATVYYEKPSSVKTALMLNGGTLEGSTITVTSEGAAAEETHVGADSHAGAFDQSDKPRAGIAAEYLAKGYVLSDHILQQAIELDSKHGISNRFLNYIQSLDTSLGEKTLGKDKTISGKIQETISQAGATAQNVDQQRGISATATDYYSKAFSSPLGQQVKNFYTTTSKQLFDIHEEARRIAALHKPSSPTTSTFPHTNETPVSTATGTVNPPISSAVQSTTEPIAPGSAGAGITGGPGKTDEAPTVL